MRVLILSVTAGFGHHATAKAIGDMLESKGAEVHTLDVYAYISNLIKTTIDKGYLFSSKHMQTLYRLVYQLAENNGASYFNSAPSIINIINALGASKFAKVIANHVPDVIICTHVFAAQMVDELKKRKKLADIETIGIVTDYTLHPYWEDVPRVQYIVTASELLTYRCVQRGIPEDRILPFGIPVHPKFNEKLSREDAAAQLGIGLHGIEVADAELCRRLPDKVVMHRVDLHRCDAPCSARGELVAYRPRPGKEVEHVALLEIHQVAQYVEQVFLGEIGRRACPQVARRVDGPPLVFSADYSHTIRLK